MATDSMAVDSLAIDHRGEALLRHQAKVLANLNKNPFLAVLLTVSCLAYIVSAYVEPLLLVGWLALVLCCQMGRRIYIGHLLRQDVAPDARRTMRALTLFSILNGAAVGLSAPLFFADIPDFARAGITVLLVGLVSGSNAAAAGYLPIFVGYMLLALTPLAYSWAAVGNTEHMMIGALVFLLIAVLLGFARETQRLLVQSFDIRFEHERLLAELARKHDELMDARDRAEQAGQAKARVLAAASHDLRQPLHALSLYSAVLASNPNQHTLATVAQHIDLSVRALSALLNALLDLSRLDAGVFRIKQTGFDAGAVLSRLCQEFAPIAQKKGLTLAWQPRDIGVYSDPLVFERIARNLIDNAIKYTDAGGVEVTVVESGALARFIVSDTGKGIPATEQQRVFEEFYQLNNPGRDREQGLGLGLSIVKRLAELVGSSIVVESAPGCGSSFSWQLPRTAAATTAAPLAPAAQPSELPAGARVLILDDEDAVRHGMALLLQLWGVASCPVADGEQAHQALRDADGAIDLIIADLRLKDGADGLAVALALRECWGPIPVLLASGETDPAKLKHVAASGFSLLHKPVSPEALHRRVAELLGERGGNG